MATAMRDRLSGVPTPATTDLVTGLGPGVAVKVPCRVVATSNITLSGLQTVDGVTLVAGDRVLCIDQTSAVDNGIYTAATGEWARAADFSSSRDAVKGTRVHITDGTGGARKEYFLTTANPVSIGSSSLTFEVRAVDESTAAVDFAGAETVASATETDIGAVDSNTVTVSGTDTIDSFGTANAGVERWIRFSGAGVITHHATNLILPGAANITRAAGDTMHVKSEGAGAWRCYAYIKASGLPVAGLPVSPFDNRLVKTDGSTGATQQTGISVDDSNNVSGVNNLEATGTFPVPQGYISGLTLSNNVSDTSHDIDIATGVASSDTTPSTLSLSATLTKRIDAAWAVGTGNGGLDTGTVQADTWYYIYLIKRSDTGAVDALFSANSTAPTMPTNYDFKRRIGAVLTNSSANIIAFRQVGDIFTLAARITNYDSIIETSATLMTMTAPPNMRARFMVYAFLSSAASHHVLLTETWQADTTPSSSNTSLAGSNATEGLASGEFTMRVDASSQIRHRGTNTHASSVLRVRAIGWIDDRGRS